MANISLGSDRQETTQHNMKTSLSLTTLFAVLSSMGSLHAGPAVVESTSVVQQPAPEIFGTGFYLALDMGANVYQDRGGSRTFSNEFGDTLVFDPKNDVGFYGGIKAGWSASFRT